MGAVERLREHERYLAQFSGAQGDEPLRTAIVAVLAVVDAAERLRVVRHVADEEMLKATLIALDAALEKVK